MNLPSRKTIYIPIGIFVLGGLIFAANQFSLLALVTGDPSPSRMEDAGSLLPSVEIDGTTVPVLLATSSAAVRKGLSGRASLEADQGMLFLFLKADRYRFWMPDMHFPIDIIWIENGRVVDIDENVSNDFDPANPVFFSPPSPVRYVLEVNAGFSKRQGIDIGDAVMLRHIE